MTRFLLFIVVVRVHANLDGENVDEAENEIVTRMAKMLIENSIDQPSRIFTLVHQRVIAAKKGQSIVLYIHCKTIQELQELKDSLTSGQLKDSVELWFNSLLVGSQKIALASLTISDGELWKIQTYIKGQNLLQSNNANC